MGLEDFHNSASKPEESKEEKPSDKNKEKPSSKEEFLDDICRVAVVVEDIPTQREYKKYGRYKSWLGRELFGGWKATIEEAKPKIDRIMRVFILESIVELRDELGKTPKFSEYREKGKYSISYVQKYFGSWTKALNRLGLETHNNYLSDNEELAVAFMSLVGKDEEEIIREFNMDKRYKNPINKISNIEKEYIPERTRKFKYMNKEVEWLSEQADYNAEDVVYTFVRAVQELEKDGNLIPIMIVYNKVMKEYMS